MSGDTLAERARAHAETHSESRHVIEELLDALDEHSTDLAAMAAIWQIRADRLNRWASDPADNDRDTVQFWYGAAAAYTEALVELSDMQEEAADREPTVPPARCRRPTHGGYPDATPSKPVTVDVRVTFPEWVTVGDVQRWAREALGGALTIDVDTTGGDR